ncbi:hypothetical protein SteCoe_2113 [Stentor coeruleus]|uniref:ABC transporter domain-containing protein n=1 Tax=Stentor coeruleus TaxID=5963 RepID=A0A1R2D042_9CILI|nr:hypothetical protein SteCoe_2113 [Stentor coeruleus]
MIIGSFIIMGVYFGLAGILGLVYCVLQIPLIYFLSRCVKGYRGKIAEISDRRVKLIKMLIEGIRTVKIHGWESCQLKEIFKIRKSQNQETFKKNIFISIISGLGNSGFVIAILITLGCTLWFGNELKASEVFAGIAILYLAFKELNFLLPDGLIQIFMLIVTCMRIQEVLLLPEGGGIQDRTKKVLKLRKAFFGWNERNNIETFENDDQGGASGNLDAGFEIKNIKLSISKGILVVGGKIGSGKSSFLLGLLGEMSLYSGKCKVSSSISFFPDHPWLMPNTIRKNIILNQEYDNEKYKKVLNICCLIDDLQRLKYNDLSIIGDQGTTLSGGQKARIALARALYKDSDIYILDDPFSALDVQTGKKIFKNLKKHYMDKIIVISSYQAFTLKYANKIIILSNGFQEFFGNYESFLEFYEVHKPEEFLIQKENNEEQNDDKYNEENKIEEIQINESISESFTLGMLYKYIMLSSNSHINPIFILIIFAIVSGLSTSVSWWISYWVDSKNQSDRFYIYVLVAFIVVLFILEFGRSLIFCYTYIKSSEHLHNNSLKGLVHSPCSFYDQNPTGRLLSRFTRDIIIVDEILYFSFNCLLKNTFDLLACVVSICIIAPYNLISFVLIVIAVFCLMNSFSGTIKKLRNIDLSSRSQIFSLLNTTIHGLSTIRAHNMQAYFNHLGQKKVTQSIQAAFTYNSLLFLFRFYADLMMTIMNLINIIILALLRDQIGGTLAALSLSFTITISGLANIWAKHAVEISNLMSSTQKLFDYSNLEEEGVFKTEKPFKIKKGEIEFKDVCMRYRPELNLSLNNMNLKILAGTKLGVMGRTGAGKSSLFITLLRLVHPESGKVLLDGKDYMRLGITDLRSQISVIPQIPIIFSSSIRENIDPFQIYSDNHIKKVFQSINLEHIIFSTSDGIEAIYGKNIFLSTGEKQLLSLARALVRDSKIILIDEATANIDKDTEKIIQQSIKDKFKEKTVLIIAHRINTIKECDLIAVINEGKCEKVINPLDVQEFPL